MRIRNVSTRLFIVIAALAVLAACGTTLKSQTGASARPAMDSLVTAEWLSQHLNDPDLVVLDCTVGIEQDKEHGFKAVSGRAGYERGHIATAGFADLLGDLSADAGARKFVLPTAEQFAAAMGALGVGDDSRVVLYSATGPGWPARVWWMLRWVGFDRAALLDGGLKAWTAEGRPLSTEPAVRPAKKLSISLRPAVIAGRDEVRAAIGNPAVTIIDVLPEASFLGKMTMYPRPGHIRGAVNIPTGSLNDESGRYLPREKLAAMHTGDRTGRVITYCGGGIAASSSAFVMSRLGFTNVAVYMGSLQDWTSDPANPMETDPQK